VSPEKTAESIEMPFGLRTRVGPGNHVLDGGWGPDAPWIGAIFGERGVLTVDTCHYNITTKTETTGIIFTPFAKHTP